MIYGSSQLKTCERPDIEVTNKSNHTLYLELNESQEGHDGPGGFGVLLASREGTLKQFITCQFLELFDEKFKGYLVLKPAQTKRLSLFSDSFSFDVGKFEAKMAWRYNPDDPNKMVLSEPFEIEYVYPTRDEASRAYGKDWEKRVNQSVRDWYKKHRHDKSVPGTP